jgi:ferric iron reductase protein FhuF
MTGEMVTPEVEAILRSDFQRTCGIDIEADSTITVDEQAEQEGMAQIMQSMQAVMQGTQALMATGAIPPPVILQLTLELLKMFLHPIRYSRPVVQMINDMQEQLQQQMAMQQQMPPPEAAPPPGMMPEAGAGAGPVPNGPAPPPGNGAMPPPPMM